MNYFDTNPDQLYCELSNAIELDDFEKFRDLLLTHREWFPFDYAYNELLHMACRQNRIDFVRFLLEDNNVKMALFKNHSILNEPIEENIINLLITPFAERVAHQVYSMGAHLDYQEDPGYVSDFEVLAHSPVPTRSPLLALTYENTTHKRKRDDEGGIRSDVNDLPKKRMRLGGDGSEMEIS